MQRHNLTALRHPAKPGAHRQSASKFPHISPEHGFYSESCADVAIAKGDFEEARAHLLTATEGTNRH